ncbi:MAG: transposase [Gemmatimonadota bacterium]
MVFHLVSRTHRHEPWFEPALRPGIARLIQDTTGRTDAELMAYAVMPNHIHVLLRQGYDELKDVMQPLLRRVAYRVQQYHGFEGEDLRGSWLPRRLSGVRRKVIRSALERGFRNGKLALFFNVSASTVSAARYSS